MKNDVFENAFRDAVAMTVDEERFPEGLRILDVYRGIADSDHSSSREDKFLCVHPNNTRKFYLTINVKYDQSNEVESVYCVVFKNHFTQDDYDSFKRTMRIFIGGDEFTWTEHFVDQPEQ